MSDAENFPARWSRLKREKGKTTNAGNVAAASPTVVQSPVNGKGGPAEPATGSPQPFDPASLPSIESITASSDIRAFLQSGVPADLTKAALRRAWTTDPAIRDFIGIAENQWDFTDPAAMPGFGPLEPTDNVRQLVAQAMGQFAQTRDPTDESISPPDTSPKATPTIETSSTGHVALQVSGMPEQKGSSTPDALIVQDQINEDYAAAQQDNSSAQRRSLPNRRCHGGALPE